MSVKVGINGFVKTLFSALVRLEEIIVTVENPGGELLPELLCQGGFSRSAVAVYGNDNSSPFV